MLYISYQLADDPILQNKNKDFEKIKLKLAEAGVYLDIGNEVISITLFEEDFDRVTKRGAGRKKKAIVDEDELEDIEVGGKVYNTRKIYRYSDIVCMMQSMTDKAIMSKLNLKQSTYYRRKKDMKNSEYFRNLDKNRLEDREYLESMKGNSQF